MLKIDILPFKDPVIDFDIVNTPLHKLWLFLTPKRLLIKNGSFLDKKLQFQEELTLECFEKTAPGVEINNKEMVVVATAQDIYVLISNSAYSFVYFRLSDSKSSVLKGHVAPITVLTHFMSHFALSGSEDHSLVMWDLKRGCMAFKVNFLYYSPCAILSGKFVPHLNKLFFGGVDLCLGIFSSEELEKHCQDIKSISKTEGSKLHPFSLASLQPSLIKKKKFSDSILKISFSNKMLLCLMANFSIALFDVSARGELSQLALISDQASRCQSVPQFLQTCYIYLTNEGLSLNEIVSDPDSECCEIREKGIPLYREEAKQGKNPRRHLVVYKDSKGLSGVYLAASSEISPGKFQVCLLSPKDN